MEVDVKEISEACRRNALAAQAALCSRPRQLRALKLNHFLKNRIERARDAPLRKMRLELPQVGDVADVVAGPVLVHVPPRQFPPGKRFDLFDGLQHGNAVRAAS